MEQKQQRIGNRLILDSILIGQVSFLTTNKKISFVDYFNGLIKSPAPMHCHSYWIPEN